jgi:hypothetical protein
MGADAPLHQPIPLARSILWSPGGEGPRRPGDTPFPIFIAQPALAAIHEHLAEPPRPGQGLMGFLVGDLCECPETHVSYVLVDSALRLNQPIYGDRTTDVVTRLWDRIAEQTREQQGHLIGWYHTHPPLPIVLSLLDVETHERYFAEPWQVAMIVGTGADGLEPEAAFFRAAAVDAWHNTPLQFYELLGEESLRPGGRKRSFVTWRNYRAYNPVADKGPRPRHQAAPPEPVAPASEDLSEPDLQETPEPAAPAAPDMADAPPPPLAAPPRRAPAEAGELVFLSTAEDAALPSAPPPAARPTPGPSPRLAPMPPRPPRNPPGAAPFPPRPRAAPGKPAPVVATPAAARLDERAAEPVEEPAAEQVEARVAEQVDERVGEQPEEPVEEQRPSPVRAPRAVRRPRRRRRRLRLAVFAILLAGGAAGLYFRFKANLPILARLPSWGSLPFSKRQGAAPRPEAASRAAPPRRQPPARTGRTAAAPPSAFAQLDQAGESLAESVRSYNQQAALFDGRQLGCDGLVRGLRAVEDRWVRYSAARPPSGVLDPERAVRDQTLYARVDSAERRFDRSGCRRP